MIAQVIRQLARLQKRAKELGNGDDIVGDYKIKINIIRRHLQNTKEDLDSLVKAQNEYQSAQTLAWDALKDRISTFKNNFNRRLESAMKDDDDDEMVNNENDEPQTNDGINDPMTQQRKFPDTGRNDAQ